MDQSFVDKIYREVGELHIELERDPTVLGPNYIHEVISRCRNYLNKASHTRLTLSKMRRDLMVQIGREETLFAMDKDRLLAEDDVVKRAPNIRDREALVNTILRDRVNTISGYKTELLDLETVEKAVKMVHDELIRTSTEIKTQRALLYSDRVSGAGYGDESNGGSGSPPPKPSTIDEDELEELMRKEVPLVAPKLTPKPVVQALPELPVETPAEPEVDSELMEALASLDAEVPTPEETKDQVASDEDETKDLLADIFGDEEETLPDPVVSPATPVVSPATPVVSPAVVEPPSVDLVDPSDPALVSFLADEVIAPPPTPKKAKASKTASVPTQADGGDFDFSDLLSNL
jgi:hypothetical protein